MTDHRTDVRPRAVRAAVASFRGLLSLLPGSFRDRHAGEAMALMERLAADVYVEGGSMKVAGLVIASACDLLWRMPAEYFRVDAVGGDLLFAARSMRRNPIVTAAAVATLAIGIGFNAAVFSIVDWVLLRPLPYPAPQALVRIWTATSTPPGAPSALTASEFARVASAPSLQASAAFSTATRVAAARGIDPFHAVIARVAGDLFGTLGSRPLVGRALTPDEIASAAPVALISEEVWRRHFFGDSAIVGRELRVDRDTSTIVGVMPAGRGLPADADVWRPMSREEREDDDRELTAIGRLARGVTLAQATADLRGVADPGRRIWPENLQRTEVRGVRASLVALWASCAVVLVMACASVAALVGSRAVDRSSELATRAAVGASRARLLQQLVTESLLLSAIGGAAGLLLGRGLLDALIALAPAALPRTSEIALDWRVTAAGLAGTLVAGLGVGIATSVQACRLDPQAALGGGARGARVRTRARRLLVLLQTATAVMLTVTAVLFGRTLRDRVAIDHGFAADRLIAVELTMRGLGGDEAQRLRALIDAAERVPGVRGAAVALRQPQQLTSLRAAVRVEGAATSAKSIVMTRPVTRRYFDVAGIPVVRGRAFDSGDRRGAPRVAVVNAAFVRDVLGSAEPVGVRVTADLFDNPVRIVGVAADVTPAGEPDRAAMYVSLDQISTGGGTLLVRTDADPRAVLPLLAPRLGEAVPSMAFDRVHRVAESLEAGRSIVRFNTQLATAFALLALLLAIVSIYGLTAGQVVARSRELAIRVALGSTGRAAMWIVMAPSARALALGAAAGVAAAAAVARWAGSRVDGLGSADPLTLTATALVLSVAGLTAALVAASRVLRGDPARALRI